ncbi:MAG: hypothetical protein NW205_03075 [Hyphomicrobiaceae bacterium]|nr:hypothetical protein [Hyphomicrobiaceae bacterium]
MPITGTRALARAKSAGFASLPISPEHAAAMDGLPHIHADPFDRMLIIQAQVEPAHLLTSDTPLASYPISAIVV